MRRNQPLPSDDHVVRYVPWSKLRKDEDGNPTGLALGTAFELRPSDSNQLSVSHLQHFTGPYATQVHAVVKAVRNSFDVPIGKKSAFVIGNVDKIRTTCLPICPRIRVVFAPSGKNPSHSLMVDFRDDALLLDELAADVFTDIIFNADVP